MAKRNWSLTIANPLMKFILRSPLHKMASSQIMLITVTGRKSGKKYTTPVNFVELDDFEEDGLLSVVSHQHRTWWRNLRGGAPVTIVLRGQQREAHAEVIEDPAEVAELLYGHLLEVPQFAVPLGVGLDDAGVPIRADADTAAIGKVMVEVWQE
ncbi:MAG: nitroreductase family deazaflavin-dependent oxidoreductase [Caldilineaceae bacterium]